MVHRLRLPREATIAAVIAALAAFIAATAIATEPAAAADPPPSWTLCANEGQTCTFAGIKQVRYGANGKFLYRTVTGSVACTNAAFGGDPVFGVVKRCELPPTVYGTVKWFDADKGYGFITPDGGGQDVFAHYSEIMAVGYRALEESQRVVFDMAQGTRGPQANNIRIV